MTHATPALLAIGGAVLLASCTTPIETPAPATPVDVAPAPPPVTTTGNPDIAGVPMPASRTIAQNLADVPTLMTLVAALKASGLDATLGGAGPFTVFAPTDAAFGRQAPGVVTDLLKPENRAALTRLLDHHVVAGTITTAQLMRMIAAGGGTATLTTLAGQPLRATMTGDVITLTSATGNQSYVEIADVRETNGMVHVVNGVLVPKLN